MKIIDLKDFEEYSSFFRGKRGKFRAEVFGKVFAINKVNALYERSENLTGPEFAGSLLNDLGVNYEIGYPERLKELPEGAFITISNHPYGGLDGIILIDLFGSIRQDYKFMVNKMLGLVKALNDNFIHVTPITNKKKGISKTSINGIKETMVHIGNGHPVGFFPSGAVSDFHLSGMKIRDRHWQESILHLIYHLKVPVLPVRFFDRNSALFYFLGLINWRIRSLRLPSELFNKKESRTRIGIGNLISAEEQKKFGTVESLGKYLRNSVYNIPLPGTFIYKKDFEFSFENSKNHLAV